MLSPDMDNYSLFDDGSGKKDRCDSSGNEFVQPGEKDTYVQLVISLSLGLSAFFAFCILRPRWKSLYAARRRQFGPSIGLPLLPDSFFGWIPALYKITEEQVLASAGLDAFVFLQFFRLSIKLFAILFFFAAAVLEPINRRYIPDDAAPKPPQQDPNDDNSWNYNMGYLWAYLVFTYFFTLLTIHLVNKTTFKVIKIRQDYLGTQSTITDRTFKLSGMPMELRDEGKIKELVERLEIGNVKSVTLCRDWRELDDLVAQRAGILRKLEETWSVFLGQKPTNYLDHRRGQPISMRNDEEAVVDEEASEETSLLNGNGGPLEHPWIEQPRPQVRIWYGLFRLRYKVTDAIDYYEEKLRRIDEQIYSARKKEYPPVDQAFVTMDSIAACQMATQALIDPRPGQLLTKQAPAPSDVVWRNTYASRNSRRIKAWIITIFITILSVIWLIPVATIAGLLSLCTIGKVFPDLASFLDDHEIFKALVQTGLPTAVVSLLNIAVPFFYDYLSNSQGMLSQGEVELSVVSKNFFFTFFNIFLVFTVFGTASKFWAVLRSSFKDTTYIAQQLARQIQNLNVFYLNFIMLQGLGLFPFRLLEFGVVSLYPINRLGAKTPRDFITLSTPPVFSYGFYLPTALLVFILCLVYSVLPRGYVVLAVGVVYFTLGYFTYKYQLLYAMDQPQHATGGAWRIICYRMVLGLVVFQVTMAGYLVLQLAFFASLLVIPLLMGTVWYSYYWRRQFEPLTNHIALRSIRKRRPGGGDRSSSASGNSGSETPSPNGTSVVHDELFGGPGRHPPQETLRRRKSTIDEDKEKGLRFVNPSLVVPLEQPWIYHDPPPLLMRDSTAGTNGGEAFYRYEHGREMDLRSRARKRPPVLRNGQARLVMGPGATGVVTLARSA
ncbi:Calcium permeable stress-gated cation channel 1 [Cytospora mali]|uniref:Calcium permeable stress-gated cation channel 1 n=1 Tax=Cytospora mali TaxID=578113 RepID=A0A194VQ55_CYTMA|nr:Calcium permeable stress-gated cation channel 1 [Valsa mali]